MMIIIDNSDFFKLDYKGKCGHRSNGSSDQTAKLKLRQELAPRSIHRTVLPERLFLKH